MARFAAAWLAAWLLSSGPATADVFCYEDAAGVLHFTNVPGKGRTRFRADGARPSVSRRDRSFAAPWTEGAYDEIINEYAGRYEVEPALVKAVIRAESGFRRTAVSPKGARGLMQLMPQTARQHGVFNVYDPEDNIRGGVKHLRLLLDRHGRSLPHALAAYNAGSGPVARSRGIPDYPETREYVARVLRFRRQYQREERLGRIAGR